jgi:hypothetical protein
MTIPGLRLLSSARGASSTERPPVRTAFFYVPNGVNMADWRPTDSERMDELPTILKSLAPVKDRVSVISNFAAEHCHATGASHEPAGGGFLVGAHCKHSEVPEVGNASVDQWIARKHGQNTPIESLALGIDPGHRGDHGYSGTYMSHISWRNKSTPVPLELNPKHLYHRLFHGQAPNKRSSPAQTSIDSIDSNVLDLVREDANRLQRQLGYSDRLKMEEYMEGIRGIEKRINIAAQDSHSHHQDSFRDDPHAHDDDPGIDKLIIPDGKGIPSIYADHVNLMLDILVTAFQTDTTRVASFLFSYEKSGRSYPQLDAPGAHHSTSHHQNEEKNLSQLTRINCHHMELFSRMLQRMAAIPEGAGTLLDNVAILYGCGISDGNSHSNEDLPILVAGGAGGRWQGGRHLKLDTKTPICNLYLEFLQAMGIEQSSFGDSTERFQRLSV